MATTHCKLIGLLLFLALDAHAAPKPVSISGSQVWTNDGVVIRPYIGTFGGGQGTNWTFNGLFEVIYRDGPHLQTSVGNGEFSVVDTTNQLNTSAIDIYGYPNGDSTFTAAIALGLDGTYGDCLLIDPRKDNGGLAFKFSTATGTSLSQTETLFSFQSNHITQISGTVAGQLVLAGTTNQITFGATNEAPVSTVAPTKWISVQVQGENTKKYRIPLYE